MSFGGFWLNVYQNLVVDSHGFSIYSNGKVVLSIPFTVLHLGLSITKFCPFETMQF
ncbi:hypothetical protein GLYMA_16G032100v4 [Glycine max]|uniref:Uncharacterized protein n=1 Tax=Glycine max TaxID=3847 RepID=K7MF00_SOYBN|nr:hypothetical protein JHK85_044855 [Glycine max]KAH1149758.1 hypothetical protein GYH30_043996 [Glycine max]KRH06584.1 hypothetical protein GLYMA_16G032100v4 [Glycine max]